METIKNTDGSVAFLSMSGKAIPFSVNPGPQLNCEICGLVRFGVDIRNVGCVYCAKALAAQGAAQ